MSRYQALRRWVRTPRGQAAVLLGLLLGAIPLALAVALNRAFFEGYVREKYEPAPAAELVKLADAIEQGSEGVDAVRKRSVDDRDALYAVYMTTKQDYARLPRVLVEADPAHFRERLARTFAAGSADQRVRAAAFAEAARSADLKPTIEWARRRAERLGPQRVKEALTRAVQSMVEKADSR